MESGWRRPRTRRALRKICDERVGWQIWLREPVSCIVVLQWDRSHAFKPRGPSYVLQREKVEAVCWLPPKSFELVSPINLMSSPSITRPAAAH